MKLINKNLINLAILALTLILILSTIAYAKPFTDAFRGGLVDINDFFTGEQYKPYAKTIDFFFFALLFISVYMIGVRYAFKEAKRPEKVIAILLGLMTAFLLVLGGFSATVLIPYIPWLLYTLLFILYWWLLKGIKSKFWRFLLALLLTLLTIGLVQGLFDSLTAPDAEGFFKSLGKSFAGIKFPELPGPPGVPTFLSDLFGAASAPVTTPTPVVTTPTPTPGPAGAVPTAAAPEKKGLPWWAWALIAIALAALLGGGIFAYKKGWLKRGERPSGAPPEGQPPTPAPPPEELTIQRIINEIVEIIKLKQKILKAIREILDRKKKLTRDLLDVYHKLINDPNFDPAYLLDKESEQYKNLMKEHKDVTELLILELQLEEDLIKLRIVEELLNGDATQHIILPEHILYATNLIGLKEERTLKLDDILAKVKEELGGMELKTGKLMEWSEFIANYYKVKYSLLTKRLGQEDITAPPEWYMQTLGKISAAFKKLLDGNQGLVLEIKEIIGKFLLLAHEEKEVEKQIKKLTDFDNLKHWLKEGKFERWIRLQPMEGKQLKRYFELEEYTLFDGLLMPTVLSEMNLLKYIMELLKFLESERKSFTQLQNIKVDINAKGRWREVTEQATDPNRGIQQGIPIKVYTRLAEGILPIKCGCYADRRLIGQKEITTEKYELIEFELTQLNLQPGGHIVIFVAVSPKGTYRASDTKKVTIYIRGQKAEETAETTYYEEPVYSEVEEEKRELERLKEEVKGLEIPQESKERIEEEISQDIYELLKTEEISTSQDAEKIADTAKKISKVSRFSGLWNSLAEYLSRTRNVKIGVFNFIRVILTNIRERRKRVEEFIRGIKNRTKKPRVPPPVQEPRTRNISDLLGIDENELEAERRIKFGGR